MSYLNMHLDYKCYIIWNSNLPECSVLLKHQEGSYPCHQMQWIWAHLILQQVELKIGFVHSNQPSYYTIIRTKSSYFISTLTISCNTLCKNTNICNLDILLCLVFLSTCALWRLGDVFGTSSLGPWGTTGLVILKELVRFGRSITNMTDCLIPRKYDYMCMI